MDLWALISWITWNLSLNQVTPRRKSGGAYKTWKCNNGSVDGRCYRDPNDPNDIIFVPVGLDENTFDYNRNGLVNMSI